MMSHNNIVNNVNAQGASKHNCSLLAVLCEDKLREGPTEERLKYPFPELVSSGRLEVRRKPHVYAVLLIFVEGGIKNEVLLGLIEWQVRTLSNPSLDELRRTLESWKPNVVYLQGQLLSNDKVGSLVWDGVDLSNAEAISDLFSHVVPTTVC